MRRSLTRSFELLQAFYVSIQNIGVLLDSDSVQYPSILLNIHIKISNHSNACQYLKIPHLLHRAYINDKTLPTQTIYVRVQNSFVLRFSRLHANLGGPTQSDQCIAMSGGQGVVTFTRSEMARLSNNKCHHCLMPLDRDVSGWVVLRRSKESNLHNW